MFKNLIRIGVNLSLFNTTYVLCKSIKDEKLPHYHFLNEQDLNKLLKKHQNLSIIDKSYTEHILSIIRDVETDTVVMR